MREEKINQLWNSPSGFERVYNQYAKILSAYAMKFVSLPAAQDIVQDLFLELWVNPPVLKISLKSYLFTAIRNACLDHLKSIQVRERYINHCLIQMQIDEIMYYQEDDISIIEEEQLNLIYESVSELPEKCREIFEMYYYRQMKSNEIAAQLQLSARTVQNQLYKGLIKLRDIIAQKKH